MATKDTYVNVLNAIRAAATPDYQNRVPQATRDNLASVGNPILNYAATTNEFLNALVNRIGMVLVRNREMHNPLAILKKGGMPLGFDIEEIAANPAIAETYNAKSTDLLAQREPDVKAVYHRLNRQDRYTVTIRNAQLKQAFTSFEHFENLVNAIVNSLYSGNYLDEFVLAKNLFASAVNNNKIVTETVQPLSDENACKDFITKVRTAFSSFGFPSSAFNTWVKENPTDTPYITWTPPENIIMIIRADVEAIIDVNVLASAFNMSKTDFMGNVLIVDNFGSAENCLAVMCDKAYTQIYDNLTEMTEFFNASNMTWNYYLHVWQTYSVSPFANALAFVTS